MNILFVLAAVFAWFASMAVIKGYRKGLFGDGVFIGLVLSILVGLLEIGVPLISHDLNKQKEQELAYAAERELMNELVFEMRALDAAIGELQGASINAYINGRDIASGQISTHLDHHVPLLYDGNRSLMDFSPRYRSIIREHAVRWASLLGQASFLPADKEFGDSQVLNDLRDENAKYLSKIELALAE